MPVTMYEGAKLGLLGVNPAKVVNDVMALHMSRRRLRNSTLVALSGLSAAYLIQRLNLASLNKKLKRKIDVTLGRNKKKDSKVGGAKGKAGKGPSPSRKVNEVGDKIENVNADEQKQETKKKKKKRERVGVNGKFLRRLIYILRIIIPKWNSKSFFFLLVQTLLLIARSLLSIKMAKLGGEGLKAVVVGSWHLFAVTLLDFSFTGLFAALVNAGLKFMKKNLHLLWRQTLTEHVHDIYLENRNYYEAAVVLAGQGKLDNADQRIVTDLDDFCFTAADLFNRTFKPALDVILSTSTLAQETGYQGPILLYLYFLGSAVLTQLIMPPFAKRLAEEKTLEGNFRRSHGRLIAHAEEIALLNGAQREKVILNSELEQLNVHLGNTNMMRLVQNTYDQYTLKYLASCIGYPVIAVPFLISKAKWTDKAALVSRYRLCDTLIKHACTAVGDLLLVYKKVQRLAGLCSRVAELLESITDRNSDKEEREGKEGAKAAAEKRVAVPASSTCVSAGAGGESGVLMQPSCIVFKDVSINTPDKRLLIDQLDLQLSPGTSLVITGPNGAGKSSLIRALAGLWPCSKGSISTPKNDPSHILFVPQSPYLVSGTLRDQVIYPLSKDEAVDRMLQQTGNDAFDEYGFELEDPELDEQFQTLLSSGRASAHVRVKEELARLSKRRLVELIMDQMIMEILLSVGLEKIALKGWREERRNRRQQKKKQQADGRSSDTNKLYNTMQLEMAHHDWSDVLSGGEQQRIGIARLYFHKPKYGVLDESTSAMNVDVEGPMYERALSLGITLISIAHRLQLRKYHNVELNLHGDGSGAFSLLPITDSYQQQVSAASPEHKKSPTNHHTQQENAFLQSDAYDTEPHARTGAHVRAQSRSDSIDFDNDTSLNPDTSLNNHAFTRYMKRVNSKANMKKVQSSDV